MTTNKCLECDEFGEACAVGVCAKASVSTEFTGSISVQSTDELRVLVELLCHTKGGPGFDIRIARLRKEAAMLWEDRK